MPADVALHPPGESPFHVKGVAYRGALDYYDEMVSGGREAVMAALPSEALRRYFETPFTVGGWYDVLPFLDLDQVAAQLLGEPLDASIRRASAWQAQRELGGIYRVFIRLLGASTVANVLPRMASQYYDFGRTTVETAEPRSTTVVFEHYPRLLVDWLPTVGTAYIGVALEMAGVRDVRFGANRYESAGEAHGYELVTSRMKIIWAKG